MEYIRERGRRRDFRRELRRPKGSDGSERIRLVRFEHAREVPEARVGDFLFSNEERAIKRIEKAHPEGLSSRDLLRYLGELGVSLSEATFRKYVQLGLLPRSVRVGEKGKHRGSRGLYPVRALSQVLLIKRLLSEQYSIEQVKAEFLFLTDELSELEIRLEDVLERIRAAAMSRELFGRELEAELIEAEGLSRGLMERLELLRQAALGRATHLEGPALELVAG